MNKNIRTKIQLKEETVNQITLTDLLDLGTKAQIAVIQLSDQCMKFDNDRLRKISADVNKQVAELCNQIKGAIINNNNEKSLAKKGVLDAPDERPERHGNNNVIESVSKKKKNKAIIKKLLEALDEATDDEDTEEEENKDVEQEDNSTIEPEEKTNKKIDLSSAFTSVIDGLDDEQFENFKSQVLDSLKGSGITDPEFQQKVSDIETSQSIDDFNFALDGVYDYADKNEIEIKTEGDSEAPKEEKETEQKEEPETVTESKKIKK